MNPSEMNDPLSRTLADWRVVPRRDPGFRAAVSRRIAPATAGSSWRGYARAHASALAGALAVAVVLGAWVGRQQARSRVDADRAQIVRAYVRALDARAMATP